MQNPVFVTLNDHRIKVQRWHEDAGTITFTTVIRGENLGNDLANVVRQALVRLDADTGLSLKGSARILDRHTSGVGPTAVHRLEIRFTTDASSEAIRQLSADEKLDAILAELQQLRREIRELRGASSARPNPGIAPPAPGTTMLDFEIPVNDDQST